MDFNPGAKSQLVTASGDGSAIIWNTAKARVSEGVLDQTDTFLIDTSETNSRQIRAVPEESIAYLRGHRSSVVSVRYTGNSRIVTASDDGTMRIWDARTGALMQILAGHEGLVAERLGERPLVPMLNEPRAHGGCRNTNQLRPARAGRSQNEECAFDVKSV